MSNKKRGLYFVIGQFALLALLFVMPHGHLWFLSESLGSVGIAILMLGLVLVLMGIVSLGNSLTASPVPKNTGELRTTGMYAIVRHPIYLGFIVLALGLVILSSSLWSILVFVAFIVLITYKARFEEHLLREKYPDYAVYASKVGQLVPFVGRRKTTSRAEEV
jgi:protein-S-isoprenylcysteine O-methyltransferase Ste14